MLAWKNYSNINIAMLIITYIKDNREEFSVNEFYHIDIYSKKLYNT